MLLSVINFSLSNARAYLADDPQNDNNEVDNQLEEKLSKVTKEFRIIGKFSSQRKNRKF